LVFVGGPVFSLGVGRAADDQLTTAERDELKQLRKENAELKRANEILKAASVFFAQEIDRPRTRPSK
jgi:transposase